MTELEDKIVSLTSQLNEFKDKLTICSSDLNEARNQLSESYNKLSEVEKNYKLLTGDHVALSSTSLEQCDEVILTLTHSQEKLQKRRVSDEPTIFAYHI